jgi:hypothetical protein
MGSPNFSVTHRHSDEANEELPGSWNCYGIRWFIDCNGRFPTSNFNISMAKKQLIIVDCYGIQNSYDVCMGW